MQGNDFSFWNEILKEIAKWSVPLLGGIIAIWFTPLIEKIKLRLNRADLRAKQFEEFAVDLTDFIFHTELMHEFHTNDWTSPKELSPVIEGYNKAITTLRKKEFVYLGWAHRFWNKKELPLFEKVLGSVKSVDVVVHRLNEGPSNTILTELKHYGAQGVINKASLFPVSSARCPHSCSRPPRRVRPRGIPL